MPEKTKTMEELKIILGCDICEEDHTTCTKQHECYPAYLSCQNDPPADERHRRVEYETFPDPAYYDMWAVRKKGEKDFNRTVHVINEKSADELVRWLTDAPDGEELSLARRIVEMEEKREWDAIEIICMAKKIMEKKK